MMNQVLASNWVDKSKNNAIDVVCQYAEFLGNPVERPNFRPYQNTEMYVPNPEMIKQFIYRIRKIQLKAMVKIAVETGARAGEVWQLTWRNINLQNKTVTITGIKGHRTSTYPISDELCSLLMQIPREEEKISNHGKLAHEKLTIDKEKKRKRHIVKEKNEKGEWVTVHDEDEPL